MISYLQSTFARSAIKRETTQAQGLFLGQLHYVNRLLLTVTNQLQSGEYGLLSNSESTATHHHKCHMNTNEQMRNSIRSTAKIYTVSPKKTCDYSVSQKKSPPKGFLKFFPKRLGIFNQFFTHLLYDHFYTRIQIFIQISPTLIKLCHTKRDHVAKFYISLEL